MTRMTKSWAVTLVAFIMAIAAPIADGPLADYGIIISEKDIEHFLYLMFGIGATGVAAKGGKKLIEKKSIPPTPTVQTPTTPPHTTLTAQLKQGNSLAQQDNGDIIAYNHKGETTAKFDKEGNEMMPQNPLQTHQAKNPKYTNEGWFQTDLEFEKGTGAVMRRDDPFLWIKVPDAVYIKGGVYQGTDLEDPTTRLVQIDSNTGDSLRFEMYDKTAGNIVPLPPGKYMFRFAATYDMKGLPKAGDGVFTIV